ncbi:hypothetical protein OPV22_002090 [Ensete ventricosum]|uniref:Uncharacterized protein n=1 Tax=Ensete ventricosum TaxID=4639 RepID=A0AAV8RX00_ENSVE|nr:hypothetical protein OPV22_002090 [Ensete ventricosum]
MSVKLTRPFEHGNEINVLRCVASSRWKGVFPKATYADKACQMKSTFKSGFPLPITRLLAFDKPGVAHTRPWLKYHEPADVPSSAYPIRGNIHRRISVMGGPDLTDLNSPPPVLHRLRSVPHLHQRLCFVRKTEEFDSERVVEIGNHVCACPEEERQHQVLRDSQESQWAKVLFFWGEQLKPAKEKVHFSLKRK